MNPRVQSGWYERASDPQMRTDSVGERPPSSCTSEGGAYAKSEDSGVGASGSVCSSSRRSPLNSDPGSSGRKSSGKKSTKKSGKSTGELEHHFNLTVCKVVTEDDYEFGLGSNIVLLLVQERSGDYSIIASIGADA